MLCRRACWSASTVYGIFLFGLAVTLSITEVGKLTIGRLRPHFFDVCRPDFSTINCAQGYVGGQELYFVYELNGNKSHHPHLTSTCFGPHHIILVADVINHRHSLSICASDDCIAASFIFSILDRRGLSSCDKDRTCDKHFVQRLFFYQYQPLAATSV
jgi:hypothetical protein